MCTIANTKFLSIFQSAACMNEMIKFLALATADIRREDLLTLKVSFLWIILLNLHQAKIVLEIKGLLW